VLSQRRECTLETVITKNKPLTKTKLKPIYTREITTRVNLDKYTDGK